MSAAVPIFHRRFTKSVLLVWLAIAAAGTLWCWREIRQLGDLRERLGSFLGWFAVAFVVYLGGLWAVRWIERTVRHRWFTVTALGIIALVAIGGRLLLLPVTPVFSDDIYRYRWDGRVQLAGIDPYRYPPNHPSLSFLRDADFSRINFPHLRTVYPPLMEWAFRLGARFGQTITAQKAVFLLAELLTCVSLILILHRRGRSPLWVLAYAWHPLIMLEIAGQGHNDAVGIAFLWLGLAAWDASRPAGAAIAWAGAFLAKLVSMILAPWWWFRHRARRWLPVFLLLSLLPLALQWRMVPALVGTFSAMTGRGSSNASIYEIIIRLVGSRPTTPLISLGLWAVFVVWCAKREEDPIRYLLKTLSVAALLAPALHPWYLTWLVPCFCFQRMPALMLLTATAVLAYTVWPGYLANGSWVMPRWARCVEYGPVAALFAWQLRGVAARAFATRRVVAEQAGS